MSSPTPLKPVKSTRLAFGESLARLGEKHAHVVALDADLSKSTMSMYFAKKFPERFFEMGIAEANMIGTAAGLAFAGKLPFLCSFGAFLTGRYDTIRLSVAYANANVRMIGTHAGVGIGDDGHSQMGLEDLALMRALPTMAVFQPMDARETELLMDYLVEVYQGPAYVRLTRQNLPDLFPAGAKFEPGKLLPIRTANASGGAATSVARPIVLIASGAAVAEAVQAHDILAAQGIATSVYNCHSLKPFDDAGVIKLASGAAAIVTVEDHSVIGGLGSCVAEALATQPSHARLIKLGVQDLFGESGEGPELYDLHGISAKKIAESVSRIARETR